MKDQIIPLRLNLGCGSKHLPTSEGWVNIDSVIACKPDLCIAIELDWPWEDGAVDEINASHVLEHLDSESLLGVMCEAYRVLKSGGRFTIEVPHPRSDYFIGDPTHQTPITEHVMNLFSRKMCDQWAAEGVSNTPLAIYLSVDFDMIHNEMHLNPKWLPVLMEADGTTVKNETYFRHAVETFNNVVHSLKFVLERV